MEQVKHKLSNGGTDIQTADTLHALEDLKTILKQKQDKEHIDTALAEMKAAQQEQQQLDTTDDTTGSKDSQFTVKEEKI